MPDDATTLHLPDDPNNGGTTLAIDPSSISTPAEYQLPTSIGRYRIIRLLGEGGMGAVYEAEQDQPRRHVALKVIKAAWASPELLRRFEQESQALGRLHHPGIAQIYEAGSADTGFGLQPFFAMDLIHGKTLVEYAEEHKLNTRQRLELMIQVCDAVQHAHQRGIIHRDLKPSNILVDETGQPKILDFGLARITDSEVQTTRQTDMGQLLGTLAYMSPEQVLADPASIDTRSDVYALGVILYQLLAGKMPYTLTRQIHEIVRTIQEVDPAPLSTVNRIYRGDIETIVAKALEKDKARRYSSANGLAVDIRRYLDDQPISAKPASATYQLQKFARRNKALVAGTAAVFLALSAGVVASTLEAVRARTAARDAMAQRDRAAAAEHRTAAERDRAVAAEDSAAKAATEARDARGQAEHNASLALAARDNAIKQEAAARQAEAAEKTARASAEENAQLASRQATLALGTIQDLASQVQAQLNAPGLYDIKTSILNMALARIDSVAAVYDKSTSKEATVLAINMNLSGVYRQLGQTEKAAVMVRRSLEIAKARVVIKEGSDASRQNLGVIRLNLAGLLEEIGRDMNASLNESEESVRILEDIRQHPKPAGFPVDPKVILSLLSDAYQNVGVCHYRLGDIVSARAGFQSAYDLRRQLLQESPGDTARAQALGYSLLAMANTSFRLGDLQQAADYHRQVLQLREKLFAEHPSDSLVRSELGDVIYMIGDFKMRTGDLVEARSSLERSREIRQALADADPRNVVWKRNLAYVFLRLGDLSTREKNDAGALQMFQAALQVQQKIVDGDPKNEKHLMEFMVMLAAAGQEAKATEIADRFNAGSNIDNELRVAIAQCFAMCARADNSVSLQQTYTRKALESLRAAVANGYRDRANLETEPELDPLRTNADFRSLLAGIPQGEIKLVEVR
jgi:tetratricopeptide (TPR) repeat protein